MPRTLTTVNMKAGLRFLSARDPELARALAENGPPPLWARPPGFRTLVRVILEQQVSLASAKACYERLVKLAAPLSPRAFLSLDDGALKSAGFSRQKILYCRHLARAVEEGQLDLRALARLDDADVRSELTKLKGIGNWTADIYLLMALRRPDIWPEGDLALALAVQRLKRLSFRPTPIDLNTLSAQWRPWRAVAARIFWHYYLSSPRGKFPG